MGFSIGSSARSVSGPLLQLQLLLLALSILSRCSNALQVIGGNVTVVEGGTVILPCKLTDTTESISQISWQRKTRGKPKNDNFFTVQPENGPLFVNGADLRFKFIGSINEQNGSLQLSNVSLLDEGIYSCIFTLFPSGNHKTEIPLNLLVPPVSSVKDSHPLLSNEEDSLATCIAAASRPPAEVKWVTGSLGEKLNSTTSYIQHDNGTTTTVSSLFGVPTREISGHLVNCVITYPALLKEVTLPFTLQAYFSPMKVNIIEKPKNSFECVTEANPNANYSWSRPGQSWPESSVKAEGPVLQLLSISSTLNGLYQCEASNIYGKNHFQLYVHVTSETCTAGWVLFGLLLSTLVISSAAWYIYKFRTSPRTEEGTHEERQRVSTSPQEALRIEEEEEPEPEEEICMRSLGATRSSTEEEATEQPDH